MKIFVVFILLIINLSHIISQNPITPIGTYIADPTARVWDDGKIYIYGSTDESINYWCSYKHDVLFSSDMKKWNLDLDVFSVNDVKETNALLYAPDVMYRNGYYYLYFCTPDRKYSEGVAVSKSPLGPFINAKKLNVGKYNEIDPTIFIDDDGQAYYYWGQFSLKGAKMKSNMTEIDESTIRDNIINRKEHFFHEGSFVFKRNNLYYILYAHEGRRDRRPTCLGYATSGSPLGPFVYRGVIIDNFGCDPETWNNHGSIAEYNGQWYVFYHRSSHGSQKMRRACVEPIYFNEDGSIDEVEMTSQGAGKPLDAFSTIEAERACFLNGYCRVKKISNDNEAICTIKDGDYLLYKYVDFGKICTYFSVKLHSYLGGYINIRLGGIDGKIIGSLKINPNSDRLQYETYNCEIATVNGIHELCLEFIGMQKGAILYDIDSFIFK